MNHSISAVVVSNSDDFIFLEPSLKAAASVFQEIIISIGSRYWNNEPENMEKITDFSNRVSATYPNVKCIMYSIPDSAIKEIHIALKEMYWEGHARAVAVQNLKPCEYILFLDADEIIDGPLFLRWLDTGVYRNYSAMKLRNFWYWREPIFRARGHYEDSVVLIKNGAFSLGDIFSNMGRHGMFMAACEPKIRNVAFEDIPMIHHYSWVRSKENMLRKVRSWGHKNDKNWVELVEEEFSRPFNGKDLVYDGKISYEVVDNIYGIRLD